MADLAKLGGTVAEFAVSNNLTMVPAVPEHFCGPEVRLGPDALDLPEFLALAGKLGASVLYLVAVPFDPSSEGDLPEGSPEDLTRHKGQVGEVSVAFMSGGLVHFWEHSAPWYQEWQKWQELNDGEKVDELDQTEQLNEDERARLAGELADTMLADPQFRAAAPGDRRRLAGQAIPKDTDSWAAHDAIIQARDRAIEMTQEAYGPVQNHLDDLASELVASPGYQEAVSAAARKKVTERFLIAHANGFSPPALVRDELYARAGRIAKPARGSGLF